ncbi:hypothetical protein MGL_0063 [Malassezia globosa CBS 7966]|uniref:Asl1-like glycosyl hydrolase catalytic domain-containing protein n=1 Tax=Malassezia globosa (strain ATCC MYA-4612 / CBS 7966) TaxID=425265 RepID=A8PRI9_MALGO|nr:uncharacterized protein MGL_0063 [Malassezia globosa CBS 7966]EDP45074.1 hypothetical protein MGL_0063 [Malassezia globosa CBS 7966]
MKLSVATLAAAATALLAATPVVADFHYGFPWGTFNAWAKTIDKKNVTWYHHWQDGYVKELKGLEYVPTFWGPTKMHEWHQRKKEIHDMHIEHILSFNEPDIKGQANIDPDTAVSLFMQELQPYALKGIKVSAPQMVWDMDWISKFMDKCHAAGCKISFMALHWYGGPDEIDSFKNWVKRIHDKFNLPIWMTEYGLTNKSNPSQKDVDRFMRETIEWMKSQPYVERAAWNGCFDVLNPPDSFLSPMNAYFADNGAATRLTASTWLAGLGNIFASNPSLKVVDNTPNTKGHKSQHKRLLM